ncbi:MAG TPA: 16S rRNA (uracil(1498)-N(3))-methyltransferase [Chloroflexi bacterium]|nr:16S rRNA (uracil(1498)-N(3))-methyltransferase [Chloroflexota bacterium]
MHRFFIPAEWIEKPKVSILGNTAHQIKNVLRMKSGRKIIVLDNFGQEYCVTLTRVAKSVVVGEIIETRVAQGEPELKISLYQGTLKAQKFEWVLQKGTELGVTEFIPVISERSVLGDVESIDRKMLRWERIIQEAAEQSKRGMLPELRPAMMFGQACQRASSMEGVGLLAWEDAEATSLRSALEAVAKKPSRLSLFIGSEGGFTLDEARLAHGYTIQPVWLGKRILRAETAGLVAASAIFYHFGEME